MSSYIPKESTTPTLAQIERTFSRRIQEILGIPEPESGENSTRPATPPGDETETASVSTTDDLASRELVQDEAEVEIPAPPTEKRGVKRNRKGKGRARTEEKKDEEVNLATGEPVRDEDEVEDPAPPSKKKCVKGKGKGKAKETVKEEESGEPDGGQPQRQVLTLPPPPSLPATLPLQPTHPYSTRRAQNFAPPSPNLATAIPAATPCPHIRGRDLYIAGYSRSSNVNETCHHGPSRPWITIQDGAMRVLDTESLGARSGGRVEAWRRLFPERGELGEGWQMWMKWSKEADGYVRKEDGEDGVMGVYKMGQVRMAMGRG